MESGVGVSNGVSDGVSDGVRDEVSDGVRDGVRIRDKSRDGVRNNQNDRSRDRMKPFKEFNVGLQMSPMSSISSTLSPSHSLGFMTDNVGHVIPIINAVFIAEITLYNYLLVRSA